MTHYPLPITHYPIQQFAVTAEQMRAIEGRIFAAGMPIPALMEKVAGLVARRIQSLYPRELKYRVGIMVGPGHNGGDALVVARELHFRGYEVVVYQPLPKLKELTQQHAEYVKSLGILVNAEVSVLKDCNLIVDGLFGFGLERSIEGKLAQEIHQINSWNLPILSIDLPSGLHTDTGEALGVAIKATRTFCLGLWKLGLLQEEALAYTGTAELVDFDIPPADIQAVLGTTPKIQRITAQAALARLPVKRPLSTYKYKLGHLLLIAGSHKYTGAAILTGLGARASGVGMLSLAVPESIKSILSHHLPEALIIGCPETDAGAIEQLPIGVDLKSYDAIAAGPGVTIEAARVVEAALETDCPVVLDADGLNILAHLGMISILEERKMPVVFTPHSGEFKRLFPDLADLTKVNYCAVKEASRQTGAIVLLKGPRTAIGYPDGSVWINPESTPALARGGSGDVLTGLIGGLMAQAIAGEKPLDPCIYSAVWWHAQAGILAASERTEMGVDAFTLTQYLMPALSEQVTSHQSLR
jgi:hydroxyethylthiazole kinase-like uncharacterized protein yjeF